MVRRKNYRLNNRLKKARKIMRYTHADVMVVMGMRSNNRISQWEHGVRQPSLKNAIKLSILYKTLPDHIYFDLREQALREVRAGIKLLEAKQQKSNSKKPP